MKIQSLRLNSIGFFNDRVRVSKVMKIRNFNQRVEYLILIYNLIQTYIKKSIDNR